MPSGARIPPTSASASKKGQIKLCKLFSGDGTIICYTTKEQFNEAQDIANKGQEAVSHLDGETDNWSMSRRNILQGLKCLETIVAEISRVDVKSVKVTGA